MIESTKRREFLAKVGATSAIGLAGYIGSATGQQQGGQQIRVGVLQPVTGDLASVGRPIRDAALLPATQLNNADTDFQIDTQAEDTQTDPQAGISAAQALVDAGYPSITGAASSEVTIQVSQNVLIPNQVVGCSPASTSPEITGLQDNGFIWRTCPSDTVQGEVLAQIATDRVNASSVSVMYVNNSYGQALANSFAQSFGGQIPAQVAFEQAQSSYAAQLQEAMSNQPDALLVIAYPESGNQLFRDYYSSYSRDTQILVTDGLRDPALPGNVGQPLTNVIGTAPSAAGPAGNSSRSCTTKRSEENRAYSLPKRTTRPPSKFSQTSPAVRRTPEGIFGTTCRRLRTRPDSRLIPAISLTRSRWPLTATR
ncbi:ABC transporter substrate-binding protein [Haladaptatus pallidirubidus]|uniref:ABC transporter substrate-binding protein n=1 Tax=Haladaptatus pallidirubidus TaxID=1008152 RepID=UPI0035E96769